MFFDIGWSELLIVGLVALIVVGPKELPALMRTIGKFIGQVKETASSFQRQFNKAVEESELSKLKSDVEDIGRDLSPDKIMGGIESYGPDFDELDPEEWNKHILEKEGAGHYSPPSSRNSIDDPELEPYESTFDVEESHEADSQETDPQEADKLVAGKSAP